MKVRYLKEDFRKISDLKADTDKKLTADDIRNSAHEVMTDILRPHVEQLLVNYFINPQWWANTSLSRDCNLRPGNQSLLDFNIYLKGIQDKDYDEQVEYLHETFPYEMDFRNNQLYLILPLSTCDSALYGDDSRTLFFKGNTIFRYLMQIVEKGFINNIKYPVNIKYKLEPGNDYRLGKSEKLSDITDIFITKDVNINLFVKFFKEKIINYKYFSDDLDLILRNRVYDTDLKDLYPFGDIVKFRSIFFTVSNSFANKIDQTNLTNLDGIDNLLNSTEGNIAISKFYFDNPEFSKNVKNGNFSKYIQIIH